MPESVPTTTLGARWPEAYRGANPNKASGAACKYYTPWEALYSSEVAIYRTMRPFLDDLTIWFMSSNQPKI